MMKRILSILLCLTLIFSLAACGGSEGESAEDSTQSTDTGETAGSAGDDSAGSGGDGVITMGVSGIPDLDPATSTSTSSNIARANLYDTLVYPEGDEVIPRVAESWEVSDDGLDYTFYLVQGIKFHDGGELTASDVKFSMDRLLTIGEGFAYIFSSSVESTEVIDDYTVTFHLSTPFGGFVNALVRLGIVSEETVMANIDASDSSYGEYGDYGKTWLTTHDAGSGAYQAVELVQQDYFYAEKFDDWFVGFDNEYAPDAFKMMAITESATVRTMFTNRELDITDMWQSAETLAALAELDGASIAEYSSQLMYNMYLNTQAAPMDDVNFRRAICCIIDYDTICSDILIGSKKAIGPVSTGVAGAAATTTFDYDLDKAREYLAASKYADNYQDYRVEILVNTDVPDLEKIALMVQAAGAEIGLNIEITKAPWSSIIDMLGSVETTPQMTMINSMPAYNEAGAYLEGRYHSSVCGSTDQGEWLQSDEIDSMIESAKAIVDQDERFAAFEDVQNFIVDEYCPTAYLCDFAERVAYQSAYITWPIVEGGSEDELPVSLNGFTYDFSRIELHTDQK